MKVYFTELKPIAEDQLLRYGLEMTEVNDEGDLPLHTAMKHQVTPRVTKTILHTYPQASFVKDEYGFLPIHLAAMYNYPLTIFELLLDYYPLCIEASDPDGLSCLHLAIKYQCNEEVILFLVKQSNPSFLNPIGKDKPGLVKAFRHQAYIPWYKICLIILKIHYLNVCISCIEDYDTYSKRFLVSLEQGDKYLAKEEYVRLTTTILHFAVQNQAEHTVIAALLESYPVLSRLRDFHGELALHYAVRNHSSAITLHTLLRSNPRSGNIADRMNRVPVQYLLKHFAETERKLQINYPEPLITRNTARVTFSSPWSAFLSQMSGSNASRQLVTFRKTLATDRKLSVDGNKGSVSILPI